MHIGTAQSREHGPVHAARQVVHRDDDIDVDVTQRHLWLLGALGRNACPVRQQRLPGPAATPVRSGSNARPVRQERLSGPAGTPVRSCEA
ncbi:hypothetical protein GCM10011366_12370 [Ornithinimicrobium tianjinense]|uniref:Uncharacterized protein n=1 Tax=Ornithinimicrobium tianjinense TaxID=1195761 RepID=A0A917F2D1_9MICO|nr:hypothetical protein GCM10011366_12370 [Ornithinimicrobium tianjinense]